MLDKLIFLLTAATLLAGCSSHAPGIEAICQRDEVGNYLVKWETNPAIEGRVRVEVSDSPESFPDDAPTLYANISDGVATYITNDNITRKYFRLTFNDRYSRVIGARSTAMDSVQNLRDMGGYFTDDDRMVRWGKVFRSGQLGHLSGWDTTRLDNLRIKTIIDLRTDAEADPEPIRYTKARVIRVPVSIGRYEEVRQRMAEGRIRKGDAQIYMEDEYLQFITDNTPRLAEAIRPFLDEANYPILVCCSYGKDRTGFLSALLLTAIGVPYETIVADYLTSNQYIDTTPLREVALHFSTDAQESLTVLLTANRELMDLAFAKIRKDYGSTERYLTEGMSLTDRERRRLKEILSEPR